jgi:hypothetical protein
VNDEHTDCTRRLMDEVGDDDDDGVGVFGFCLLFSTVESDILLTVTDVTYFPL